MPSEAKNQKSIIFDEKYNDIFNEDLITAERMLVPYKAFIPLEEIKRNIQRKKRRKEKINEKEAFVSRAIFHLLNAIGIIIEKETLDPNKSSDINKSIRIAIKYVGQVVKIQSKKRGELYTHDKFFKEIPTNQIIRDYIISKY
jgi:hypothetical protein